MIPLHHEVNLATPLTPQPEIQTGRAFLPTRLLQRLAPSRFRLIGERPHETRSYAPSVPGPRNSARPQLPPRSSCFPACSVLARGIACHPSAPARRATAQASAELPRDSPGTIPPAPRDRRQSPYAVVGRRRELWSRWLQPSYCHLTVDCLHIRNPFGPSSSSRECARSAIFAAETCDDQ